MKVSFVIPCYRSSHTISGVVDEIQETMEKSERKDYEIILVNDSSPDDTFDAIQKLCASKTNIIGIDLSRKASRYSNIIGGALQCRWDGFERPPDGGTVDHKEKKPYRGVPAFV